ncbi:MAG: hypothetical protein QM715_05875 [Nibricoccus sp.]
MPISPNVPRWNTLTVVSSAALSALLTFGLAWLTAGNSTGKTQPKTVSVASFQSRKVQSSQENWSDSWHQLQKQPACAVRNKELAAMLEQLARTDPQRALALAEAESNWILRDELLDAALRGWGATAPDAAADWAINHRLDQRMRYVSAVLSGAVEQPSEAVRVALRVCKADPGPAADYGHALINALVDKVGSFAEATRFASTVGTDRQQFLLDSAYYQWAKYQPEQALASLNQITDPNIKASAYEGMLAGWAAADATKLASLALSMPPGEDRLKAFNVALPKWIEKDPTAATEWIGNQDPSPDLNAGVAAIATLPSMIARNPLLSFDWADSITDSAQRIMTKHEIFTQWAQKDFPAAVEYARNVKNPDERDMMTEALAGMRQGG